MATITEKISTEKEALALVKQNGWNLREVPNNLKTPAVVKLALDYGIYAAIVQAVPASQRTFQMVLKSAPDYGVETKDHAILTLDPAWGISQSAFIALVKKGTVPNMSKVTDTEIILACWKKAFAKNAQVLQTMPGNFYARVLNRGNINNVLSARDENGRWIGDVLVKLVPKALMTSGVIRNFQQQVINNIEGRGHGYIHVADIPQEYMTDEVYEKVLEKNSSSLRDIPQERITFEMSKIAVQGEGSSLEYVPEEMKEDFYLDVVKSGTGLNTIPEDKRTDRLCTLAVETSVKQFQHVPEDKKSYAICLQAIDGNAEMVEFIPQDKMDEEMMIRFLISLFGEKYEKDYNLTDKYGRQEENSQPPLMKRVFDDFFENAQGTHKRTSEVREIMNKVIARVPKLYFALLRFEGKVERDSYKYKDFNQYFSGVSNFDHAVVAAQNDIEVVAGFDASIQEHVWKHFLETREK